MTHGIALAACVVLASSPLLGEKSDDEPRTIILATSIPAALVTSLTLPLGAYLTDDTRGFPLLLGFLVTGAAAGVAVLINYKLAYATGSELFAVPGSIVLPFVAGATATVVLYTPTQVPRPPSEPGTSRRQDDFNFLPSHLILLPAPHGVAAAAAWRF